MNEGQGITFPTRTCVGCGCRDRQSAMVRLRRDDEGRIAPEHRIRTGRSAYVHARTECVRGLVRSKVLGKSLRQNVSKETRVELAGTLERALAIGLGNELASGRGARLAGGGEQELATGSISPRGAEV